MKKKPAQPGTPSYERSRIAEYLKHLKFKPRLFGVDQADVWKKLEELNALYEEALKAQQYRYEELLQQMEVPDPDTDPSFWELGEEAEPNGEQSF